MNPGRHRRVRRDAEEDFPTGNDEFSVDPNCTVMVRNVSLVPLGLRNSKVYKVVSDKNKVYTRKRCHVFVHGLRGKSERRRFSSSPLFPVLCCTLETEGEANACLPRAEEERGGKRIKKKRGKGPLKKKGPLFIFGEKKAAGGKATGTMLYTVPFFLPFLFLSSCEGRAKLCFFCKISFPLPRN